MPYMEGGVVVPEDKAVVATDINIHEVVDRYFASLRSSLLFPVPLIIVIAFAVVIRHDVRSLPLPGDTGSDPDLELDPVPIMGLNVAFPLLAQVYLLVAPICWLNVRRITGRIVGCSRIGMPPGTLLTKLGSYPFIMNPWAAPLDQSDSPWIQQARLALSGALSMFILGCYSGTSSVIALAVAVSPGDWGFVGGTYTDLVLGDGVNMVLTAGLWCLQLSALLKFAVIPDVLSGRNPGTDLSFSGFVLVGSAFSGVCVSALYLWEVINAASLLAQ